LIEDIKGLDDMEEHRNLTTEEKVKWESAKLELQSTLLLEVNWRQKLHAIWLKDSGRNTKFFYKVANSQWRNNFIGSITEGSRIIDTKDDIHDCFIWYYQH
jgi:hypothetical protein